MHTITKGAAVLTGALLAATGLGLTQAAQADTSDVTIRTADLNISETRATGHVDFVANGLHVWTESNTSSDKAAGYFAVSGGLPTSASLTWYGTQPQPGQQIVFDVDGIDGNGNDYNILVGEPIYGDNWWLTGGSSADAKAVDPSGANNGGNGSEWFGTLAEWAAALPDARFYAGGFSLGSGVKGDGFLESITYGDTTYTFTSEAAPTVVDVTGKSVKKVGHFKARLDFISTVQPADTVQGKKLKWRVTVDGKRTFVTKQGFGDHDILVERFAKNSGKHRIEVFKNGVKVRHFAVRTHV